MNVQELLWKYAEGRCNRQERAEVEQLLSGDIALQQDLAAIRQVQAALAVMELEQPSMRFVQRVMEKLPQRGFDAGPLIRPFWKKVFWTGLAASIAATFFLPSSTQAPGTVLRYTDEVVTGIDAAVEAIPPMVLQYFVLLILVVVMLAVMDKILSMQKRPLLL